MELKEKLISLRRESGLTQMDVAERIDVTRQTVSRWESGEALPTAENIRRLSELYKVPTRLLTGGGEELEAAPEAPGPDRTWRKPTLIGVAIGLAIALIAALLAAAYFIGYEKGVKDTTPTYPVHTEVISEEDIEGSADLFGW